jgi:hypothetical protein
MVPATVNGRPAGLSAFASDEFSVTACSLSLARAPAQARKRKVERRALERSAGPCSWRRPSPYRHGVHKEEASSLSDVQIVHAAAEPIEAAEVKPPCVPLSKSIQVDGYGLTAPADQRRGVPPYLGAINAGCRSIPLGITPQHTRSRRSPITGIFLIGGRVRGPLAHFSGPRVPSDNGLAGLLHE